MGCSTLSPSLRGSLTAGSGAGRKCWEMTIETRMVSILNSWYKTLHFERTVVRTEARLQRLQILPILRSNLVTGNIHSDLLHTVYRDRLMVKISGKSFSM